PDGTSRSARSTITTVGAISWKWLSASEPSSTWTASTSSRRRTWLIRVLAVESGPMTNARPEITGDARAINAPKRRRAESLLLLTNTGGIFYRHTTPDVETGQKLIA